MTPEQRAEMRERAVFWTTRHPSAIGRLYDPNAVEFAGEVLALLDALEEAERGQHNYRRLLREQNDECREHLATLARVEALADAWIAIGPTDCAYHYDKLGEYVKAALADPEPRDEGGEGA